MKEGFNVLMATDLTNEKGSTDILLASYFGACINQFEIDWMFNCIA